MSKAIPGVAIYLPWQATYLYPRLSAWTEYPAVVLDSRFLLMQPLQTAVMDQVNGCLPLTQETWIEFLDPGCGPAQPKPL